MGTISELINYCKIDDPAGALLLTGEWGCGKTYLVENELRESLKDTHIVVRISLFGINSIDEMNKAVKEAWISSNGGLLETASSIRKYKDLIATFSNLLTKGTAKKAISSVLSINFLDFIKVERTVNEKKVVLVFDDIERCKLDASEKLGIINEYCENQGFNVIIIADETKINSEQYAEYKEKVIQRTVQHVPDYLAIVESVVAREKDPNYKEILLKRQNAITALFAGQDEEGNILQSQITNEKDSSETSVWKNRRRVEKRHSHNIRSLKVAIQDFKRIFDILCIYKAEDIDKWFMTFLALNLVSKAGCINWDDEYGLLFEHNDLSKLYPGYYEPRYMPMPIGTWVVNGEWNENAVDESIRQIYESKDKTAEEQVRSTRIDYLDETVAVEGMRNILPLAYKGELSINEYVFLILNSKLVRDYNLASIDIDWENVKSGINARIEENINKGETWEPFKEGIEHTEELSKEEMEAYSVITGMRSSMYPMFEANRRAYIRLFTEDPYNALMILQGKRYSCFDAEMARATVLGFDKVDNQTKGLFPDFFERLYSCIEQSIDMDSKEAQATKEGLIALQEQLSLLSIKYLDEPFKKRFTKGFLNVVDSKLK